MGWNLPDGCTQAMVDRAMGDWDPPQDLDDKADDLYDRRDEEDQP